MKKFHGLRGHTLIPLVLSMCWVACSRPGSGASVGQQVPFGTAREATVEAASGASAAQPQNTSSPGDVPFQDAQTLPAGTLITVRLQNPVVFSTCDQRNNAVGEQPDTTFVAVLDEAVVIDGNILFPAGTSVVGRVESGKPSRNAGKLGFVRLTLDSIELGDRAVPIQTSVLFVRGKTNQLQNVKSSVSAVIRLEQGRRLTFRLTEPLSLASQIARTGR